MTTAILYDNHDQRWADLAPRLVELTKFKLYPVVPTISQNLHETLLKFPASEKWAVVIAAGSVVHNPGIVEEIVTHCEKENSPLAGHILHRNGYYHLHPQFFCIDVNLYKQWAQGLEPTPGSFESVPVERSTDNVHDDYTPWWIKPAGTETSVVNCSDEFASRYIAWLLGQGHQIVNIPHSIRGQKIYGYAEHNYQDIRNFIKDTVITTQDSGASQFLNYLKNNLEALNFGFYPINTEPVTQLPVSVSSINVFAGVCGGIKPAIITSQSAFADNTKVVLFDISDIAIEWQRWLRAKWDGGRDTIQSVFDEFMQSHPNARAQYFSYMGILGNFDWVLKNNCSEQEFKHKWAHWKTLDVEYCCLNLLETVDQETLVNRLTELGGNAYVWTSNLFFMDWQLLMHEPGHARRCYDQLVKLIKKSHQSVVLENENYITVH